MNHNTTAVFVVPFFGDDTKSKDYLAQTIEGLYAQTDQDWVALIIDDASPDKVAQKYLAEVEHNFSQKIKVFHHSINSGPGECRNQGIRWAFENACPFILFNDADDISHPKRLEVTRNLFLNDAKTDLVYSSFSVIDDNSDPVDFENITSSVLEIIDSNESNPVVGYNAWIDISTVTGYVCLTSSTAVRTSIANKCLFPSARVSEDSYFWMHISALGNKFSYTPLIPTRHRLPREKKGSSQRERIGNTEFYQEKMRVDTAGFYNALSISLLKSNIAIEDIIELQVLFFKRLAKTLIRERQYELADVCQKLSGKLAVK